jgi:hypothetical protein
LPMPFLCHSLRITASRISAFLPTTVLVKNQIRIVSVTAMLRQSPRQFHRQARTAGTVSVL